MLKSSTFFGFLFFLLTSGSRLTRHHKSIRPKVSKKTSRAHPINEEKIMVTFDKQCLMLKDTYCDEMIELINNEYNCLDLHSHSHGLGKHRSHSYLSTKFHTIDFLTVTSSDCLDNKINWKDYCISNVEYETFYELTTLDDFPEVIVSTNEKCEDFSLYNNNWYQWGLDSFDMKYDWFNYRTTDNKYTRPNIGKDTSYYSADYHLGKDCPPEIDTGVDVFVVDTGVYGLHEDFCNNSVIRLDTEPVIISEAHGTAVASIITGKEYGVSRYHKIYDYNACNDFISGDVFCSTSDFFDAVLKITAKMREISNVSPNRRFIVNLAIANYNPTIEQRNQWDIWLNELVKEGAIIVVSAANFPGGNGDSCNVAPAYSTEVFTVGYLGVRSLAVHPSSGQGPCVDFYAPGGSIATAYPYKPRTAPIAEASLSTSEKKKRSGASIAAPHVSGMIAEILTHSPKLTKDEIYEILAAISEQLAIGSEALRQCNRARDSCRRLISPFCSGFMYGATFGPTGSPVTFPTVSPTKKPIATAPPTKRPIETAPPTKRPTGFPTPQPTDRPTPQPTDRRDTATSTTADPTDRPTDRPTNRPTDRPTRKPVVAQLPSDCDYTHSPTFNPSHLPSSHPTTAPVPSFIKQQKCLEMINECINDCFEKYAKCGEQVLYIECVKCCASTDIYCNEIEYTKCVTHSTV